MPRIQVLLPEGGGDLGFMPTANYTARDFAPVAAEMHQTAQTVGRVTREWNEVQENLRNARDSITQTSVVAGVRQNIESLRQHFDGDYDPDTAAQIVTNLSQQHLKTQMAEVDKTRPMSNINRMRTLAHAEAEIALGAAEAKHYVNGLAIQKTRSDAFSAVQTFARASDIDGGNAHIDTMLTAGLFNAKEAVAARESLRTDAIANAVARESEVSLEAAFQKVNRREGVFGLMDDAERMRTLGTLKREMDLQQNRVLSEQARVQREEERLFKENRSIVVSDLTAQARDGKVSLLDLESARRSWRLPREDYDHIRDIIEKKPTLPSDPVVFNTLDAGVRAVNPTVTKEQLVGWRDAGKINRDDYDKLDSLLTANLRYRDDQTKGDARYFHGQAEQNLKEALTFNSSLSPSWVDQYQQIWASALKELSTRSTAFGGKENPIDVAEAITPKYIAMVDKGARARVSVLRQSIPFQDKAALEQRYTNAPKDNTYYNAARILREIEQIEAALGANPKQQLKNPARPAGAK